MCACAWVCARRPRRARPGFFSDGRHHSSSSSSSSSSTKAIMRPLPAVVTTVLVFLIVTVAVLSTLSRTIPFIQSRMAFLPTPRSTGDSNMAPLVATREYNDVEWTPVWVPTSDGEMLSGAHLQQRAPGASDKGNGAEKVRDGGSEEIENRQTPKDGGSGDWLSIMFYGNAKNLEAYLPQLALMIRRTGAQVLVVDYRGYGASSGHPSPEGMRLDGEAVLRFAEQTLRIPHQRTVIHGYSMGCAVAIHAATSGGDDFAALVLEAPFVDFRTACIHMFPALRLVRRFIHPLFHNSLRIGDLHTTPLLVTHSPTDEVVPFTDGQTVFSAAPTPIKLFVPSTRVSHPGPHLNDVAFRWLRTRMALPRAQPC